MQDLKKFEAFAKAHAHSTLARMKALWEEEVSVMAISRAPNKNRLDVQKKTSATASAMKSSVSRS